MMEKPQPKQLVHTESFSGTFFGIHTATPEATAWVKSVGEQFGRIYPADDTGSNFNFELNPCFDKTDVIAYFEAINI